MRRRRGQYSWTGSPHTAWLSSLLPSTGALTLISKITDRANDSMEQGVSLFAGAQV